MAFTLPPLPYDYSALEPHIDTQTMQIHHDKHHAAYVNNLNAALESHPNIASQSIEDILRNINDVPEAARQAVINNGGGHANHTLFWEIMGPNGGGEPTGALAEAINKAFGSFADLKAKINDAGAKRFGSGWSWLVLDKGGALQVLSTANQDSPHE
jgi:Fe-Mn family superoxide dismutase